MYKNHTHNSTAQINMLTNVDTTRRAKSLTNVNKC